jgi:hypothetical protein
MFVSRVVWPIIVSICLVLVSFGCGESNDPDKDDNNSVAPETWQIERIFPTADNERHEFHGCIYGSPVAWDDDGQDVLIALDAEGVLAALDPDTGAEHWSYELPAPDGEAPLALSQPAWIDDDRIVVTYHTVPGGKDKIDANTTRLSHRVAVVDLAARDLAEDFGVITLEAELPANDGGTVEFEPGHALSRPDIVLGKVDGDQFGKAYVTMGNTRDIQPWHGWAFEIDLDAWHASGDDAANSAVLVTTPEPAENCGERGSSGSRDRKCGGGLWAPSGPLVIDQDDSFELVLAPGNGQLDLNRDDYANTLMRTGPGLGFDPGCDAQACADFDPDDPSLACIETCENLWIPRLTGQDDDPPEPASGRCDGDMSLFECWKELDYIGGSTPVYLEVDGHKTLNYPTKDGHLYMVDQTHFGRQFDRHKLVENCGTVDDSCTKTWAGMAVTKPVVAHHDGEPIIMTVTFMPDKTHSAGVVAVGVDTSGDTPRYERLWEFPDFDTDASVDRFRTHPSRMTLSTLEIDGEDRQVLWLVEVGSTGRLIALDVVNGERIFETALSGRGQRYTVPLIDDERVYVSSCESDFGRGHVEGFALSRE